MMKIPVVEFAKRVGTDEVADAELPYLYLHCLHSRARLFKTNDFGS